MLGPHRCAALTRQRKNGRLAIIGERRHPGFGCFNRITRTEHVEVRYSAQGGDVLHGLVRRTVFANTD